MAEIQFRGVTKSYAAGRPAVESVDLTIGSGELLVVLGPSGSGKTTLLRILAGLESPDAGSVWIDGRDVTGVEPHRRDAAMVFQSPALYPHLSVFDNLAFGLRARGVRRGEVRERVNQVAELLGIDGLLARRPWGLSGGERQRVALGRAIVRRPRVLLCDEPFSSLDPPLRAALREQVAELHRRFGSTLVLVTHDQAEALMLGDRIAVLDRGTLLQCGTPREIYDRPVHRDVAAFVGSPPMNLLACEIFRDESGVRVRVDGGFEWPVPADARLRGGPEPGRVLLGLRPEDIALAGDAAGGTTSSGPIVEVGVARVEFNGADVLATLRLGSNRLAARLPASPPIREGDSLRAILNLARASWFDPDHGRALTDD